MNEFTTIDNIKEAFKRILWDDYFIHFDKVSNKFKIRHLSQDLISFNYNSELMTFSFFETLCSFDDPFMNHMLSIFASYNHLTTCHQITDSLFNHDVSKIIFVEPIVFDPKELDCSKLVGKRITLSPKFAIGNSWNMIFLEKGYLIAEDFSIKPIVDLWINFRGFGNTRFIVDEQTGEFLNLLVANNFYIDHGLSSKNENNLIILPTSKLEKKTKIIKNTNVDIVECINDLMGTIIPEFYRLYMNKFNVTPVSSTDLITVDEFKVLEMLQV